MRTHRNLASVLAVALALACGPGNVKPTPTTSLYDRLGGKNAIEAVVVEMLENVKADDRIKGKFVNAGLDSPNSNLQGKLVDQICAAAGGPCTYSGKDMKSAHMGMGITEAEFNALVEDLVKALDKYKVAEKDKADLLAILAPMKKDIVEAATTQQ